MEVAVFRGKLISTESLMNRYRSALEHSEEERSKMMCVIRAVIENFEMELHFSVSKNKIATHEMSKALKDVENAHMFPQQKRLSKA